MNTNLARVTRAPMKTQVRVPAVAMGRRGGNRQIISSIRQGKTITKGSIRPQPDTPVADCHLGIRLRCAVNNQLGINIEPELWLPGQFATKRTGDLAGSFRTGT